MTSKATRVLIADDHRRALDGLRDLLETWPEIQVVGEARDGGELLDAIEQTNPQVVITDVRMPHIDGLQATRSIRSQWPNVRVIVLSIHPELEREALDAGAEAFLNKGDPPDRLRKAIQVKES
ncbi:MAG: response regulator transcription factor [Nitrospiraceae bacterium]